MRCLPWYFLLGMLLTPQDARSIQLHWAGGSTDLTVPQNTQAVLVVQADSAEVTLPNSWRLQWTADSLGVQFSAFDPNSACLVDTAKVDSIAPPQTPADSAADLTTAWFCSSGNGNAPTAYFLVSLPAGGHGKMKIVALNPTNTTQVIESNEVTYNGGIDVDYAPLVLTATQTRSANTITVTAIGSGLNLVSSAAIVSRDADWSVPLVPTSETSTTLTATADVPACLPPARLTLGAASGIAASALLPGDTPQAPLVAYSYGKFHDPISGTRPKDFSFFYDNMGHFHLFFINTIAGMSSLDSRNERYFGHTKGADLRDDWTFPDTTSFRVQGSGWQSAHVWAPTMVQLGPTYYLFYTGVDAQGNQAIGVATTSNINPTGVDTINWNRPTAPIISRQLETWIYQGGSAQCRDPYVMRSPFDSTTYVMVYSTMWVRHSPPQLGDTVTTLGVAHQHSNALTQQWIDDGNMLIANVEPAHLFDKTESPHAFLHANARGDTSYYFFVTGSDSVIPREDRLLCNRQSPWDRSADTTASHWSQITSVYDQLGFSQLDPVVFYGFDTTEYCKMYNHEYIAGVDATIGVDSTYSVWITMIQWLNGGSSSPDAMALLDPVTDVKGGGERGGAPRTEGLRLLGASPGLWPAVLEMTVPRVERVELRIYDISGRAVKTLASGTRSPGSWRVTWDGRAESGSMAQSGVYFARMRWSGGAKVARMVVLR